MPATATRTAPRGKPKANGAPPPSYPPELHNVPIAAIDVGANVRSDVGDVAGLAESIAAVGVLEPIRVAEVGAGRYELVFGQRRLAAAKLAGLETIPAIVDAGAEVGSLRTIRQLVENLQREDLPPLEEARALRTVLDADPELTQAELAKRLGRAAPTVSNALRLLELEVPVQKLVEGGKLTASHAKALASYSGKGQVRLAKEAADYGWSAHEVERRVQWAREQAERDAKLAATLSTWVETVLEPALAEKGVDRATAKLTTTDGYGYGDAEALLKAARAHGWKVAGRESFSRGKCDCEAWGVARTWEGKAQVVRRCIVRAHYEAKLKAAGKPTDGQSAAEERRRLSYAQSDALRGLIADQVREALAKLDGRVGRLLLWSLLKYRINDWVRDHKGDRKRPDAWAELVELEDAALVEELATRLLHDVSPQYGVHLDWPAIAEAFGVQLEKAATS